MGDFNCRTGKYSDSVYQEGNTVITNDQSEFSSYGTQRNSFDNELNNHGKRLLEFCRNTDLRIFNGRVNGDSLERPTFHSKSGVSVSDYAICDQDLFRHIANFIVKEPSSYSDHSPVATWPNINAINQNPVAPIINDTLLHHPKQFILENESPQKFRAKLQTEHIQRMINEFLDDTVPSENVITSLDAVETAFTTTAKRCLKRPLKKDDIIKYLSTKNGSVKNVVSRGTNHEN